jgi:proteasome lid subunit RPN8/RPN11
MEYGTEIAVGTWSTPKCPFEIEYSFRVMDEIRLAVADAFFSLPRGGAEIGGILLGKWDGDRISITDYEALECEHATGPSFTLSARDQTRLAEMTARARRNASNRQPLGWYHSHTRSGIFLSDIDQEIHRRYFPEPWQIALVMKPHIFEPTRGGFFFREPDGSMRGAASYAEFELNPLPRAAGLGSSRNSLALHRTLPEETGFRGAAIPLPPAATVAASPPVAPSPLVPSAGVRSNVAPSAVVPTAGVRSAVAPAAVVPSAVAHSALAPSKVVPSAVAPSAVAPSAASSAIVPAVVAPSAVASSAVTPSAAAPSIKRKSKVPITREVAIEPPLAPAPEVDAPHFGQTGKQRSWRGVKVAAILAVGLAAGGLGYQTRDYWVPRVIAKARAVLPKEPETYLSLAVSDDDGQLKIQWDRNAPAVRSASDATIEINDGNTVPRLVLLDPGHLAAGSFTYARESEHVDVTMMASEPGGQQVKEQTSFLGRLPTPKEPAEDAQLKAERDAAVETADKAQKDLNFVTAKARKLEKDLKDAREQLQIEQKGRLSNPSPDAAKKN